MKISTRVNVLAAVCMLLSLLAVNLTLESLQLREDVDRIAYEYEYERLSEASIKSADSMPITFISNGGNVSKAEVATQEVVSLDRFSPESGRVPTRIVYSKFSDGSCEPCERWVTMKAPTFRENGVEVVIRGHTANEYDYSPHVEVFWSDGTKTVMRTSPPLELLDNCEDGQAKEGDDLTQRMYEALKRTQLALVKTNSNGTLKVASSVAEAKLTSASIVIDPALNAEVSQSVSADGQPTGPLVVKRRSAPAVSYGSTGSSFSYSSAGGSSSYSYAPANVSYSYSSGSYPLATQQVVCDENGCRTVSNNYSYSYAGPSYAYRGPYRTTYAAPAAGTRVLSSYQGPYRSYQKQVNPDGSVTTFRNGIFFRSAVTRY